MSTYVLENNTKVQIDAVYRGDVWWGYLPPAAGSTQGSGKRPLLILQNNIGNKYSPNVIVAIISSSLTKKPLPTHVKIDTTKLDIPRESTILLEMIITLDKWCLLSKVGQLDRITMIEVENAMKISLGLSSY